MSMWLVAVISVVLTLWVVVTIELFANVNFYRDLADEYNREACEYRDKCASLSSQLDSFQMSKLREERNAYIGSLKNTIDELQKELDEYKVRKMEEATHD